MVTVIISLRVLHIITAILMAWPFYALVAVNQRTRLGPPLGDRLDTYLENTIKNRTIPCFVFQATALISGLLLLQLRGLGIQVLLSNPVVAAKIAFLILIAATLTYVMMVIQPRLDALFAALASPAAPPDAAADIGRLRLRRKKLASLCLFGVLMSGMLGLQVWAPFPGLLNLVFTIAIAAFVWRAYSTTISLGWV